MVENSPCRFIDTTGLALAMIDGGGGPIIIRNPNIEGGGEGWDAHDQHKQILKEKAKRDRWERGRLRNFDGDDDGEGPPPIDSAEGSRQGSKQAAKDHTRNAPAPRPQPAPQPTPQPTPPLPPEKSSFQIPNLRLLLRRFPLWFLMDEAAQDMVNPMCHYGQGA